MKNAYNNQLDTKLCEDENEDYEDYDEEFVENNKNYEREDYCYEESREIRDIYDRMMCPSKNYDEYEIFKLTMVKLKANFEDLFNIWWNNLTIKEKEIFEKITRVKRIEINSYIHQNNIDDDKKLSILSKEKVPRTIVKIKRNNN